LNEEDAREVAFGGCTETMIAGMSNVGSLEGEINLAKALELALYDGYDRWRSGRSVRTLGASQVSGDTRLSWPRSGGRSSS